jgi:hypothetical protein
VIKEDLFFGENSRDTIHSVYLLLTVHIHDLIGLEKSAILPSRKRLEGDQWANAQRPKIFVVEFFYDSSIEVALL